MSDMSDMSDISDNCAISVQSATVGYADRVIVNDVSFDIERRQFVSILGPNGCGKTTLLSSMLGLIGLKEGRVVIGDIEITPDASTRSSAIRRELASKVALVSQSHQSTFPFEVIDLVLTGRLPFIGATSTPSAQDYEVARESLAILGVERLAERNFTTLSGGERQMVLIARALAQETDILLLDEPTTFLDISNQERVLQTMTRLVSELSKTVVAIIHEPNHALAFSDSVVLLGRDRAPESSLLGYGPAREIVAPGLVKEAYGIDVSITETPNGAVAIPVRSSEAKGPASRVMPAHPTGLK